MGTEQLTWLWRVALWGWVWAPILGVWPHTAPRSAQVGWWVFSSIAVIAVGMTQPVRSVSRLWAGLIGIAWLVCASHLLTGVGWTVAWTYQTALILTAAWVVAERGAWNEIRQAFLWAAWLQVPIVILQLAGVSLPWPTAGSAPWGSLYRCSGLSLLWGMAAFLTTGPVAWVFLGLCASTKSFTGVVIPALWLIRNRCLKAGWLPALWPVGLVGVLGLSHQVWWPKLSIRLSAWQDAWTLILQHGWLTGWGFLPFPGGFNESHIISTLTTRSDYHNVFIDWIARTGVLGLAGLLLLGWWITKRLTTPWRRWSAALAVWMGMWQSAEAFPVLALGFVLWLMVFSQEA